MPGIDAIDPLTRQRIADIPAWSYPHRSMMSPGPIARPGVIPPRAWRARAKSRAPWPMTPMRRLWPRRGARSARRRHRLGDRRYWRRHRRRARRHCRCHWQRLWRRLFEQRLWR
jgi:hypothetical protein